MKVIATQMIWDGFRRIREGEVFDLVPVKGLRKDKDGNVEEVEISVDEQFDKKSMKKYEGRKAEVKLDADFDPETEEVVIMPKKRGAKAADKDGSKSIQVSRASDQEVI